MSCKKFSSLVYEYAREDRWDVILEEINKSLDSSRVHISKSLIVDNTDEWALIHGDVNSQVKSLWNEYRGTKEHDPVFNLIESLPKNNIYLSSTFISEKSLKSNDYYKMHYVPADILYVIGGQYMDNDSIFSIFAHKSASSGDFSEQDYFYMNSIMPRLMNGFDIVKKMNISEYKMDVLLSVYKHLEHPMICFDRNFNCLQMNDKAEWLINNKKMLTTNNGKMFFYNESVRKKIELYMNNSDKVSSQSYSFFVNDCGCSSGCWIKIIPIEPEYEFGMKCGKVHVLTINTPDLYDGSRYRSEFNLTKAESEIVTKMIAGKTAVKISEDLFRSIDTIRTHIKSIYKKTKVNSQLELLSMLLLKD